MVLDVWKGRCRYCVRMEVIRRLGLRCVPVMELYHSGGIRVSLNVAAAW